MINYKIKIIGTGTDHFYGYKERWVNGCSIMPKTGGQGKSYTSKHLVNRMYNQIVNTPCYQNGYIKAYIIEFELVQLNVTEGNIE